MPAAAESGAQMSSAGASDCGGSCLSCQARNDWKRLRPRADGDIELAAAAAYDDDAVAEAVVAAAATRQCKAVAGTAGSRRRKAVAVGTYHFACHHLAKANIDWICIIKASNGHEISISKASELADKMESRMKGAGFRESLPLEESENKHQGTLSLVWLLTVPVDAVLGASRLTRGVHGFLAGRAAVGVIALDLDAVGPGRSGGRARVLHATAILQVKSLRHIQTTSIQ